MARTPQHKEAIIRTAARLFRKQGFAATGLNQIVEESGAPKGSLYHYFPEGKNAIGAAAVVWAGALVQQTLADMAREAEGPGALLRSYAELLASWMVQSDFSDGCPIATALLETALASPAMREAGYSALGSWAEVLRDALIAKSVASPRATRLASTAIAALEGALLQARVAMQKEPILYAAEELAFAFDQAIIDANNLVGNGVADIGAT